MRISLMPAHGLRLRLLQEAAVWLLAWLPVSTLLAQATTRPCGPDPAVPGPACLLAHASITVLPAGELYWHIDTYASEQAANAAKSPAGTVVRAFNRVWLFTLAGKTWRADHGKHLATVGPLPVTPAPAYSAEFLRSVFTPGMTAPLHVHSGPEAFYALQGDTCLESPDGVQKAAGPGNWLVIRGGLPMLLMATGTLPREGFALVLHDATQPATTMIHNWQPKGQCAAGGNAAPIP